MDETRIDAIIEGFKRKADRLSAKARETVSLSSSQESEIKALPKDQQEELRSKYLKIAEELKQQELTRLLVMLSEEMKNSGLPAQTVKELLTVIDRAKDAGWKFTPEMVSTINQIKEKENAEKPARTNNTSNELADTTTIGIGVAAATIGVATAVLSQTKEENEPEERGFDPDVSIKKDDKVKTIAGTKVLTKKMKEKDPKRYKKIMKVGQKATNKVAAEGKKVTLENINDSKKLSNAAKRYAKMAFLEKNPDVKKDLEIQEKATNEKAIQKSIARHQRKKTGVNPDKNKPENAPKYSKAEQIVMKRVKAIKEAAGTALTPQEISEKLPPQLRKYYEPIVRREHPEFFENRDKRSQEIEKLEKDAQEKAIQKAIARHNRKKSKVNPDKNKPENAPQYDDREKLVMKRVKKIKETAGRHLTIDEINNMLPVPMRKYYEQVVRREHPEYFDQQEKDVINTNISMSKNKKESTNEHIQQPENASENEQKKARGEKSLKDKIEEQQIVDRNNKTVAKEKENEKEAKEKEKETKEAQKEKETLKDKIKAQTKTDEKKKTGQKNEAGLKKKIEAQIKKETASTNTVKKKKKNDAITNAAVVNKRKKSVA